MRMTPEQFNAAQARAKPKETPKQRMQALGRMKTGAMNKTEQAYAKELEIKKQSGDVLWYKFEGIKYRLADNTFYTPDFAVMLANGELQAHEVKGARAIYQDDAKVKVKVAAEIYPIEFCVVFPIPKNRGGGWAREEF